MAEKTRANLLSQIATLLADNITKDISEADLRQVTGDMADSAALRKEIASGNITPAVGDINMQRAADALVPSDFVGTGSITGRASGVVSLETQTYRYVLKNDDSGNASFQLLGEADIAGLTATLEAKDTAIAAKMGKQAESAALTYAATVNLDLAAITGTFRTLTLAGDVTFTTSNRDAVRQTTIIITADGTERNLTFPVGWTWLGVMPTTIPASTVAALYISAFGANETDVYAGWALEGATSGGLDVNAFWQSRFTATTAEEDLALLGFLDLPPEWLEGFLKVVDDGSGTLILESQTLNFYGPDGIDVALADGGTGASTALGAVNNLTAGMASVPATDASTLTLDFATGRNFHVTKTLNGTLANPTNQVAGQAGSILFTQDATGSRTQAYGSHFIFPGGAPTLSTAPNTKDKMYYEVHAPGEIHATLLKDFKA